MSVRTRIEPIDRDIQLLLTEDLSPEARSATLATFAREQLLEAETINQRVLGRVPPYEAFVDGRPNDHFESVRPDGQIVVEFEFVGDLVVWIAEQLAMRSPFRTGRYSGSHVLLADGIEAFETENVPPAREYVFANTQPYARKLERGLSPQTPDGVYQGVALLAQRRFGNVARVSFTYRSLAGLAKDTSSRQPAIVVTLGR